jgi:fructose transport system permease protein
MTWLGNTFDLGGTAGRLGHGADGGAVPGLWFWLRETAAGRHVYAVGNNPEATRLVGIPTEACCWACTCWPACSTALPRC